MTMHVVGPGQGWRWLANAVNLGSHNAAAVFGGAALMMALVLGLALVLLLLVGGVQTAVKPGVAGAAATSLLVGLPLMAVISALMVGYLRILDAVESRRPARAIDVFSGFRDTAASARAFGFVLLLALLQYLVLGGVITLLAPDFGKWYLEAVQASSTGAAPPDPSTMPPGFGAAFGVTIVVWLLVYAIQAIGIGQIALRGRGMSAALVDGFAGSLKNMLPLLVLLLVCIGVAIVSGMAVLLVATLLGLLGKLAGMWLAMLLAAPLYLLAMLILYVIMFGVMYFMWRDICGDGSGGPPPLPNDRLEV